MGQEVGQILLAGDLRIVQPTLGSNFLNPKLLSLKMLDLSNASSLHYTVCGAAVDKDMSFKVVSALIGQGHYAESLS